MPNASPIEVHPTARPGQVIGSKGLMDFSRTLLEASMRLELQARYLRKLHEVGWTLQGQVDHDIAVLVDPKGHVVCLECGEALIPADDQLCEACSLLENPICPECRQGKCRNCTGEALNIHDELVLCFCCGSKQ